jgi:hypothetical protein
MVRAISFNNLQISLYDRQISFNAGSHTVIPLLQSFTVIHGVTQGRRLALLGACPWLSYCAPLALRDLNSNFESTPQKGARRIDEKTNRPTNFR